MTTPSVASSRPPALRRRQQQQQQQQQRSSLDSGNQSDSFKAQVFLAVACLWPMLFVWFLGGGAPAVPSLRRGLTLTEGLRNALDRADIMGYGPTHPRVAVVIVGEDQKLMEQSVKSVFRYTPLNRLFCVCAVVDGQPEDASFVQELKKVDKGDHPHWHGVKPDLHKPNQPEDQSNEPHGQKIHVIFNSVQQGVAASRSDAVDFIQILSKKHVDSGLKSPQEDLILLLLENGAELDSIKWLTQVTSALVVPPPLLGTKDDANVAMKLANAISFNTEGAGKRTSIDATLLPVITEAPAVDVNLSNGMDYPSPAWNGVALALRLDTYDNLPMQDTSLQEAWHANLDLSLNLWLCADGIDMLQGLTAVPPPNSIAKPSVSMPPAMAARFAAVWMDDARERDLFNGIVAKTRVLSRLEWDTYLSQARTSPSIQATGGMQRKCRSYTWYSEQIVGTEAANSETNTEHHNKGKSFTISKRVRVHGVGNGVERKQNGVEPKATGREKGKPIVKANVAEQQKPKVVEPKANNGGGNGGGDVQADVEIPEPTSGKLPSKPLDPARLEIIKKAKRVLIKKVDVAGNRSEDPHRGARDADGNFGYVHDPTALRKNPPTFQYDKLNEACANHDATYKMLTEKVFVDFTANDEAEKSGRPRDKIFCLVYTTEKGHDQIPFIRETWGPKCDGFMVGSTKTDESINAVEIPHEGPEEYDNIWQKVRSMWSYIYDNFYDDYDWFHIGGDDLYLIVENLRLYLESEEIKTAGNGGTFLPNGDETSQVPLFLGRRFAYMGDRNDIFNSGGSGYTMNKAAFKLLVVEGFPKVFPHAHTFSEDTMVARVFRKHGVFPYDTKDEAGGERYMPFAPGHHYTYQKPPPESKDWYVKYSIDIKYGVDHCAARSVAFHYIKGATQKRLHAILYRLCPKEGGDAGAGAAAAA